MSPQRKYLFLAFLALFGTLCIVAHASPTPTVTSRSPNSGSVSKRGGYPMDPVMRRATTVAERLRKIDRLKGTATTKTKSAIGKMVQKEAMEDLEREIMLAKSALNDNTSWKEAEQVREHVAWLKKEKGVD